MTNEEDFLLETLQGETLVFVCNDMWMETHKAKDFIPSNFELYDYVEEDERIFQIVLYETLQEYITRKTQEDNNKEL